jgi:hypothetical protein
MVNNSTVHQYQQNKRKFKQWWIGGIVDHQCLNFVLFCWYWWIVDHHCLNYLLFCWYWWNCWPSMFKLNSGGQQFHQYQQNKRKFKRWWSTIPSISSKQKKGFDDIDGIVDHHCLNFLLFWWYWWNCWPSLFKLSFLLKILMEMLTITV